MNMRRALSASAGVRRDGTGHSSDGTAVPGSVRGVAFGGRLEVVVPRGHGRGVDDSIRNGTASTPGATCRWPDLPVVRLAGGPACRWPGSRRPRSPASGWSTRASAGTGACGRRGGPTRRGSSRACSTGLRGTRPTRCGCAPTSTAAIIRTRSTRACERWWPRCRWKRPASAGGRGAVGSGLRALVAAVPLEWLPPAASGRPTTRRAWPR